MPPETSDNFDAHETYPSTYFLVAAQPQLLRRVQVADSLKGNAQDEVSLSTQFSGDTPRFILSTTSKSSRSSHFHMCLSLLSSEVC